MRIFKHRRFHDWAKSEGMLDEMLKQAVEEMRQDLFEGNLGGCLYKKRIALLGKGKRGGYRTLVAFRQNDKAFFIYGFAKNVRENISHPEKMVYKELAKKLLNLEDDVIEKMVHMGSLFEVK